MSCKFFDYKSISIAKENLKTLGEIYRKELILISYAQKFIDVEQTIQTFFV